VAVLAGDILYAKCFSTLTTIRVQAPETRTTLLRLFCDVTERMCAAEMGEQRILESERGADTGEYLPGFPPVEDQRTSWRPAVKEPPFLCDAPGPCAGSSLAGSDHHSHGVLQARDDSRDANADTSRGPDLRAKALSTPPSPRAT